MFFNSKKVVYFSIIMVVYFSITIYRPIYNLTPIKASLKRELSDCMSANKQ